MDWKQLLESISESANDHLRLRNEYLAAENRILRNQIDGRVQLTDRERKELAEIGAKLGKKALAEIATIAQPDTILAWNRKFANQNVTPSKAPRSVGRPRVDQEIEDWVVRMARENRSWSYDRIQGSLNHLGYTISDQTVGDILKRHGISPALERKKTVTRREFIRSHWDVLMATGFFNSEVWSWLGQIISFVLSFIHFSRHQVQSTRMTLHQPILTLQALVRCSLELSTCVQRYHGQVKAVRSGLLLSRLSIPQPVHDGFPSPHQRERCPQRMDKVVVLPVTESGLIRDGPIQSQYLQRVVLSDDFQEAA